MPTFTYWTTVAGEAPQPYTVIIAEERFHEFVDRLLDWMAEGRPHPFTLDTCTAGPSADECSTDSDSDAAGRGGSH